MKKEMFMRDFENKVAKTIKDYGLFCKEDKIIVACSGGKDSTVALHILKKQGYNVAALTIDVAIGNYTKQNLENIKEFCKANKIKLHTVSFREEFGASLCYIRQALASNGIKMRSCTICGVLRRYLLNKEARRLGAEYVVTGHNLDDEAQAIVMNIFRSNLEVCSRLGPKTGIKEDSKFVQRVKPLYFCREEDIREYSKNIRAKITYDPCPCRQDAYRNKIRKMLDRLEKDNPDIKLSIVKSFLAMQKSLKKEHAGTKTKQEYCKICKEPCKGSICNACDIITKLKQTQRQP